MFKRLRQYFGCSQCEMSAKNDLQTIERLNRELHNLREDLNIAHREIGHWKTMALNFKKHHQ